MVATRPLLYLSLPGLAFIIGLIYFRRQRRSREDCSDTDGPSSGKETNKNATRIKFNSDELDEIDSKRLSGGSKGICIGNGKSNEINNDNIINEFETKLGRSAPINITYNGKLSAMSQIDNKSINSEDFMNEYDKKCFSSFLNNNDTDDDDESYLSSVDLPDSPTNKRNKRCSIIQQNKEEPVIIKATVSPNKLLTSSFLENKYTEESEIKNSVITLDEQQQQQQQYELQQTEESTSSSNVSSVVTTIGTNMSNESPSTSTSTLATNLSDSLKINTDTSELKSHNMNTDTCNANGKLSPPSSEFSAHSDAGDSGKGSSLPQSDRQSQITNYDFIVPASLVGKLIGVKYSYISKIKANSGVNILIKNKNQQKIKICSLKGTEKQISTALSMIRSRFPIKRFPNLTLQKVEYAEPHAVVQLSEDFTSCLQLRLIEGINNDVIVTTILSANHIFVQHPSHPTYRSIEALLKFMNLSYETIEAPALPELTNNAICVAKCDNSWFRVEIITFNQADNICLVKFLDFGGYTNISIDNLKQIRADFMSMPFQATECILSNIEPIEGSDWNEDAKYTLYHLTAGLVLQAQIVRYNELNLPEVNLYAALSKNSVIFINKELVARGHARWRTRNVDF